MMDNSEERIAAVAEAITGLGYGGILAFDRTEPEYDTFETLVDEYGNRDGVYLLAVCSSLVDYKLPEGKDAQEFWAVFERVALDAGPPETTADVVTTMEAFLEEPINEQLTDQKRDRVQRLFRNDFADWFAWNHHAVPAGEVWNRLAEALNNDRRNKTVVFAMKVYDIVNLLADGSYRTFPEDVTIPVDFHVRNVTTSAGLVPGDDPDDAAVSDAWADVTTAVEDAFQRPVSVFRIDSIVWQLGQIIYEAETPEPALREFLTDEIGVEEDVAATLATELTAGRDEDVVPCSAETTSPSIPEECTSVAELEAPDEWHDVVVEVLELWSNDTDSIAQTGLVGDNSGYLKFTKWEKADLPALEEGSVYRLESVVTDEYQGRMSVSLTSATDIEESDANLDVPYER